jgi:class 3 adenylate cyclase/tetratricopeptide (TPR) repeat protein
MGQETDPSQSIQELEKTIANLEAQRSTLGDSTVDTAILSLREKQAQLAAAAQPSQQRKLVTLLFMDIVGSTSIAQHMDPEDVRDVFDIALIQLAEPVAAQGGRVTRFMGDGFLAVFGAPTAMEDDPERAVRAGLAIIALVGGIGLQLKQNWQIQNFQVRVGVNTGLVMLGGKTEAVDTLMGAAVNLAARLESAAPPGGLLVSHNTYRHIRGVFDVEVWQRLPVKGFDEPVKVYRVLRARPRAFRVVTRGVEGIETPMVGRTTELKTLQDALLNAIDESEGQIVTVIGEAGVGKSRLLYEFQNWLELLPPPAVRFYEARAYQEALHTPYGMLRHLFSSRFQVQDDDRGDVVREKVCQGLGEAFSSYPEGEMRAHLLGQWLGFDFSCSPHLKGVLGDPEQLRNRGLMYLGEYFNRISSLEPVVIFLEDIHWADDSSLDVLNWLGERLPHQRVVVVCAARPTLLERRPYWGEGLAYHHCLRLEPLSRRESRQLVLEILKLVDQVPPELRELVVEGAEGNPFYIEELVKMLIEDGIIVKGEDAWQIRIERLAEIQVPSTLTEVLQARLDSLSADERRVLQQASVVGRLFWDGVVAYIQTAEDGREGFVPQALTALRQRELIYRREESAFANVREYIFKHDILREVTYESVLKRLRKVYHGLVADWLIAQGEERAAEFNGLIAEHLYQAGREAEAGQYFLHAGETALRSYANGEAEAHFRRAIALLAKAPQRAPCLAGLSEALGRQGRGQEAVEIFHQAIELYFQEKEYDRVARLYTRLAQALWYIDNEQARKACQEGLARLAGTPEGSGLARLLAEAGRTAWFRSRPTEEILSLCQKAIDIADRIGELEAKADASITLAMIGGEINPEKNSLILHEVISFTEANGLWNQANRAYLNLGKVYADYLLNNESAYRCALRAVEISGQTGDMVRLIVAVENLAIASLELGQWKSLDDKFVEVLRSYSASPAQIEEVLGWNRLWRLGFRGEWTQVLEYLHDQLENPQVMENFQEAAIYNFSFAGLCLEKDRFMGVPDLTEAEAALQKLINIEWRALESRYSLAILYSRQKHISKAHKLLAEAINSIVQPESNAARAERLTSEAELAMAEGHLDEAVSLCHTLIDLYQAGGFRWRHARTLIDLGDALAGRNGPGDLGQAQATYQQALDMFTEMGSPGYVQVLEKRMNI